MLKAFDAGVECIGILKEWNGFMENLKMPLNVAEHDDLHIENKLKYITMFYRFEQLNTEPSFTQSF